MCLCMQCHVRRQKKWWLYLSYCVAFQAYTLLHEINPLNVRSIHKLFELFVLHMECKWSLVVHLSMVYTDVAPPGSTRIVIMLSCKM